jgi:hypothetical protein
MSKSYHTVLCFRAMANIYVLELFAGHGSVSKIASQILKCSRKTVDIDETTEPDILMDIMKWSHTDSLALKQEYRNKRPVIFASPPCEEYSSMKTTGIRDLDRADACVKKIEEIANDLESVILFIENPERGMLKDRDVINFMPHKYHVNYCQYGALYRKSTLIWCSHELSNFVPLLCKKSTCNACVYDSLTQKWKHFKSYEDLPLIERISIPDQLVVCLVRAALPIILEGSTKITKTKRMDFKINYIKNGYEGKDDNFHLQVAWRGYDGLEWIPIDNLNDPLESYDFFSKTSQDSIISKYKKWSKNMKAVVLE